MAKGIGIKKTVGRLYSCFCKVELTITAVLFILIVILSFVSALTRKLGMPIQWTMDVTQLCFAWLAFLSGDIALRNGALPGVDMIFKKFPRKTQIVVSCFIRLLMFALLCFFVYYGIVLALSNLSRTFQTLPIRYAWVTISLPVCSIFMILSIISNSIKDFESWKKG